MRHFWIILILLPFLTNDSIEGKIDTSITHNALPKESPLLRSWAEITLPIEINEENQQNLLDNSARLVVEAQRNQAIMTYSTVPWVEIALVALVGTFLLMAYYVPPLKPFPTQQEYNLQAQDRALMALKILQQSNLPAKPFYIKLTNTVRHFIEEKYQLPASTQTTEEFLQELDVHPVFNPQTQKHLAQFLIKADRVKFALKTPPLEERKEALRIAETFVIGSATCI